MPTGSPRSTASRTEEKALAARVATGEESAFEELMRRHNSALFRVARAILKEDADAEEALQDAYLDAYRHMDSFEGTARLETWLTRIVINRSLMRLRKRKREGVVVPFTREGDVGAPPEATIDTKADSPSDALLRSEVRRLVERRIDELPASFRVVFVMREVQEMSAEQIAECLSIPVATVRTRLFRARALLRAALARDMDLATLDVFRFDGARSGRIVACVVARVGRRS